MSSLRSTDTVSSAAVLDLLLLCRDKQLISEQEIAELGLEDSSLKTSARVPETSLITLWQKLARYVDESGEPLGVHLGQTINHKAKGLLASWVSQAETLGEALTIFSDNISLMNPSEQWRFKAKGDIVELVCSLDENKGYPAIAIERSMGAMLAWGEILSAQRLALIELGFRCSKPKTESALQTVFEGKCRFACAQNYLRIAKSDLDLPITSSNAYLKKVLQEKAQQALLTINKELAVSQKVNGLINEALDLGRVPTIDQICAALSMSRQTLYRHLKNEQVSYKALTERARKSRASKLLSDKTNSVSAVALQLGYQDPSSFNKAFKRWFGMTPSAFQKKESA